MTQKKRQLSHFLNFYVFLTVELPNAQREYESLQGTTSANIEDYNARISELNSQISDLQNRLAQLQ